MQKYILKSGQTVELNLAPIEDSLNLFSAVVLECKGAGLDLTLGNEDTIKDMLLKNMDALLNILGSKLVLECAKECAKPVLYGKQKFDMEIFEDAHARVDFLPLMVLVCVENLRPFFGEVHIALDYLLSKVVK